MLPKMSNRWRNAALAMAALGFIAVIARPPGFIIGAGLNAVIWFGIVYLIYLVVYGLRRVFGSKSDTK